MSRPAVAGLLVALACAGPAPAQAPPDPQTPPTLAEVRRGMAIPSTGLERRGQLDSIGYASRPAQMARILELARTPPAPEDFGPLPAPGVAAVVCPHDDYIYAGRVYERVLPLVTARTVVLIGVFHRYRRFGERRRLVFDPYTEWRTPDGPVRVAALRDEILSQLPPGTAVQDAAMHDSEHSLEGIVYWLRHARPDLEIVPVLVPGADFARLEELADHLGSALSAALAARGWRLGPDVALVVSNDGVHYGPDFQHVPFGDGGIAAYEQATARDRRILTRDLRGEPRRERVRRLFAAFVDPEHPDTYRLTWCGRFALPYGLLLLERLGRDAGRLVGHPVAYGTSVGWPELPVRDLGLGATAPASLYHFVGHPAAAYTLDAKRPGR